MGWVLRPFRANPPKPEPEPAEQPEVTMPASGDLEVLDSGRAEANTIAQRVCSVGRQSREALQRHYRVNIDRFLERAVSEQWVTIDENGMVSRGPVSPYPVEQTMDDGRSDRGWSLIDAWSQGIEKLFAALR